MSWFGNQNKRRVEQKVDSGTRSSMDHNDSVCTYCGTSYNIGQEGGHHFPSCDVRGCKDPLTHPGCQHG